MMVFNSKRQNNRYQNKLLKIYFSPFQALFVLAVCAVVTVLAEEGHSSQYIHKHDDHHTKVEFKDKHGHHDHDYYVSNTNYLS